jgi:hypothetical protein
MVVFPWIPQMPQYMPRQRVGMWTKLTMPPFFWLQWLMQEVAQQFNRSSLRLDTWVLGGGWGKRVSSFGMENWDRLTCSFREDFNENKTNVHRGKQRLVI